MSAPLPEWVIPPHEGFTVDEFVRMSELPPHTELIDGSLVFVSPQDSWHMMTIDALKSALASQAPSEYRVMRELSVRLGPRQMPEPDLMVVPFAAAKRTLTTGPASYVFAEDVLLAVEVVSPESQERDRLTKPAKYARAGIPHFWRVEREGANSAVHTYRLDHPSATYVPTGIHTTQFRAEEPFSVTVDPGRDLLEP